MMIWIRPVAVLYRRIEIMQKRHASSPRLATPLNRTLPLTTMLRAVVMPSPGRQTATGCRLTSRDRSSPHASPDRALINEGAAVVGFAPDRARHLTRL